MAHQIETMFYTGDAPWHKLGTRLIEAPTTKQAIIAAGLDWQVNKKDIFLVDGKKVSTHQAMVRSTDEKVLGVVGKGFNPLQNVEAFQFFDKFLDQGMATLETAGAIKGGQRVWILAKINADPMQVAPGDLVEKYILLYHAHDGTLAVRAGLTPVRTVCCNTLQMALDHKDSQLIKLRHSAKVVENLQSVSEIINAANNSFEATLEQYKMLVRKDINQKDLEKYVKLIFVGEKHEEMKEEGSRAGQKALDNIIPLFEKGRGNDLPSIKGTMFAGYNAVVEYLQYFKGKNEENRFDSMMFGQSKTVNKKAFEIALKMAA